MLRPLPGITCWANSEILSPGSQPHALVCRCAKVCFTRQLRSSVGVCSMYVWFMCVRGSTECTCTWLLDVYMYVHVDTWGCHMENFVCTQTWM